MKKAYIVQNPVAGTYSAEEVADKIQQHFESIQWSYEIYQTTGEENVKEIVQQACREGYDLVIAAGGDGTVSAVASGLVGQQQPLGILPVGSGNALAHDLRIPLTIEDALALLDGEHEIRKIDAMKVEDKYYLLNLSAGLTAQVIQRTTREKKRKLGRMAYFVEAVPAFIGIQPITYTLKIDGKTYRRKASEILLFNSVTIGEPAQYLNLGIENNDGKLDLFILKTPTGQDYFRVLWNTLIRHPQQEPVLERFSVEDVLEIHSRRRTIMQADGELIGPTPKIIQIVPSAIRLVVPTENGGA